MRHKITLIATCEPGSDGLEAVMKALGEVLPKICSMCDRPPIITVEEAE